MAYEIPGFSYTLPAAVDLSASLFRCVRTNATAQAALPNAIGDPIAGVLNNKPKAGEAATIIQTGIAQVEAGGAIPLTATAMTPVKTGTDGRIVAQAGTGTIVGYALEAASGAGIIIAVLLTSA